jgi:gas vesicle protein
MDNSRGFVGFCLGCAVGTAAALLLTSKSGRDTVEYLRGKVDEGTRNVKESVDAVTSAASRGMKTVRHQKENAEAAVEAGKQAYMAAQETTP